MQSQEEVYSIANAEHKDGTNRYTFRYSPHWRNIINKTLTIGVRSIKLKQAPLLLWISGLSIVRVYDDATISNYNISPEVTMTSSMSVLNEELTECRESRYNSFYTQATAAGVTNIPFLLYDYTITYRPNIRTLRFDILTTNDCYFGFDSNNDATDFISSDFMNLTGITNTEFWTDLNKLSRRDGMLENEFNAKYVNYPYTLTMSSSGITRIEFTDIWDHEEAIVKSSFVDLSYDNYIGITNETFIPPKEYPIVFGDQKFDIDLYDQLGNSIELQSRDSLIIESMMNSYE